MTEKLLTGTLSLNTTNQPMICSRLKAFQKDERFSLIQSTTDYSVWFKITENSLSISPISKRNKPISQCVKYRRAQIITQKLTQLASEATGSLYNEQIDTLESLVERWSLESTDLTTTSKPMDENLDSEINSSVNNVHVEPASDAVREEIVQQSAESDNIEQISEQEWTEV